MITPYDHEALWIKAKLFLNRAMDPESNRSFDEQALWASLALELLGKAALARVSPLLIAEPSEDGANLLIASSLIEGNARFMTVRAKTIFSRCSKAFRPFSEAEVAKITNARNEYLHGAAVAFATVPMEAWWPRYWAQAAILVDALDRDLDDLVGTTRAETARRHLTRNAKNVEHRTQALIARAKQRLSQYESGTLPAKIASEWKPGRDQTAGLSYREMHTCPACTKAGLIEGEDVSATDVEYEQVDENDYEVTVTLTIEADYFSCPHCQLVLDGYEYLVEAGIDTTFFAEGDSSDIMEPDYGND